MALPWQEAGHPEQALSLGSSRTKLAWSLGGMTPQDTASLMGNTNDQPVYSVDFGVFLQIFRPQ